MAALGTTSVADARQAGPVAAVLSHLVRAWRVSEFWLVKLRRTWRGGVVSGFVAPALYLGSLGFGLGGLVDHGTGGGVGIPYATFVAPGVLVATVMQAAVAESTYPVFGALRWQRQYHAMVATCVSEMDIVLGHVIYLALRMLLTAAAFGVVAALLGPLRTPATLAAVLTATLTGLAYATPVMAFAGRSEQDSSFAMLYRFGVVPMFLFAGTFFPVAQLPTGLQVVAWVTPLWHGTTLARDLVLHRAGLLASLGHVAYLLVWVVVGMWLATRVFTKGLSA